jgi:hypothetical protein
MFCFVSLGPGDIAAMVVGSLVVFTTISALMFYYRRRKRINNQRVRDTNVSLETIQIAPTVNHEQHFHSIQPSTFSGNSEDALPIQAEAVMPEASGPVQATSNENTQVDPMIPL